MILLLGCTGYIGSQFAATIREYGLEYTCVDHCVGQSRMEYARSVEWALKAGDVTLVINCVGYTGSPNVDACENNKEEAMWTNVTLPAIIAGYCQDAGAPLMQISSGCIYQGKSPQFEIFQALKGSGFPAPVMEALEITSGDWDETQPPNFSFDAPDSNCSFYSGTKALCEKVLSQGFEKVYLPRLRIPFDQFPHPKNYLTKMLSYDKLLDATNSFSHRRDFVKGCLGLWLAKAPYGIYNLTNPGFVNTRFVTDLLNSKFGSTFKYWTNDDEFYRNAAKAKRSNCVLDTSKAAKYIEMRTVQEALTEAVENYSV